MKKVTTKKLSLNKTTLSNLQMNKINGGAGTHGQRCNSALDKCPSQKTCQLSCTGC